MVNGEIAAVCKMISGWESVVYKEMFDEQKTEFDNLMSLSL